MNGRDLIAWRELMRFNKVEGAKALGISRNRLDRIEASDIRLPRYIELACAAITAGLNHTETAPRGPPNEKQNQRNCNEAPV